MTSTPPALVAEVEALLIVADTPTTLIELAAALDAPVATTRIALEWIIADYNGEHGGPVRGFEVREVAGGFRVYAREHYDGIIADFVHRETPAKLSQAALETLAVIAYRQPISRSQVASIRAVNVDSVVRTLANRGLIEEAGEDPTTGAVLWGTTTLLLEQLGIENLDELPPIAPLLDDGVEEFDEAALA